MNFSDWNWYIEKIQIKKDDRDIEYEKLKKSWDTQWYINHYRWQERLRSTPLPNKQPKDEDDHEFMTSSSKTTSSRPSSKKKNRKVR